jgi:hypothetical protein
MNHADLSRLTVLVLAVVFAVMGGWVISESREYDARHRPSLVLGGCMLIVVAAGLLNRMRMSVMFEAEDGATIALRGVAIVLGVAALVCCVVTCGDGRDRS